MSFFYDLMKCFNISDISSKITLTFVLGVGLAVVGKVKILNLSEEEIVVGNKKQKIIISGNDLIIKSVSKGEVIIGGSVLNISASGGE